MKEMNRKIASRCSTFFLLRAPPPSLWTFLFFVLVLAQFSSIAHSRPTLCDPMDCSTPGLPSITDSWSLLKLTSVESVMPPTISSSVVPFSSCLQSFPATQFIESGGQSIGSFSFSISPSNEHSGLISFRINLFHLLAVQGTLKSLLQHHSSKASILWHSAFFIVQIAHPYMTTGKTIALTRRTFVGKVISLLFNMLSRLVITFLPRSKCLLISWLQSPSAVILEPQK